MAETLSSGEIDGKIRINLNEEFLSWKYGFDKKRIKILKFNL